jgi:hypothetical protein
MTSEKEVIRSHKSKDRQYNGKKIINTKKTNNCLKKYSCTKPSKNPDETQVLGARKGKYILSLKIFFLSQLITEHDLLDFWYK